MEGQDELRLIAAAFARARVPLELSQGSLNRRLGAGGGQIVQMDIARDRRGHERIRLHRPRVEGVSIRALGTDAREQQLVLLVSEPARRFEERLWDARVSAWVDRVRHTPPGWRRFLVGMDESHLFIAQLTRSATSVRQAHASLRPASVPAGRQAKRDRIRRQGEWFLIPATPAELASVAAQLASLGSRRKVGIGAGRGPMRGRPHVVCESLVLAPNSPWPGTEFVRGKVRHPDHKTLVLEDWHRVAMNTEDRGVSAQWVD